MFAGAPLPTETRSLFPSFPIFPSLSFLYLFATSSPTILLLTLRCSRDESWRKPFPLMQLIQCSPLHSSSDRSFGRLRGFSTPDDCCANCQGSALEKGCWSGLLGVSGEYLAKGLKRVEKSSADQGIHFI